MDLPPTGVCDRCGRALNDPKCCRKWEGETAFKISFTDADRALLTSLRTALEVLAGKELHYYRACDGPGRCRFCDGRTRP
jgi:hypothetical protein